MKFGRFLQSTLTPEWKDAYIDYALLKKHIKAIRNYTFPTSATATSSDDLFVNIDVSSAVEKSKPLDGDLTTPCPTPVHISFGTPDSVTPPRTPTPPRMPVQPQTPIQGRLKQNITNALKDLPLDELLSVLPPHHHPFLKCLDEQFYKVELFYCTREAELASHTDVIREQIKELDLHRKSWLASRPRNTKKLKTKLFPWQRTQKRPVPQEFVITLPTSFDSKLKPRPSMKTMKGGFTEKGLRDPTSYTNARTQLKKAVYEHYRGLEMLHHYRALNLQGFQKALKKYEKYTQTPLQDVYMRDRVLNSPFAAEDRLKVLKKEMEDLYAATFTNGDKKKAITRLRADSRTRTYNLNAFCSGLLLGAAPPALALGIYRSIVLVPGFTSQFRDLLLYEYAALSIPTLLALLVGLNMLVWVKYRINYPFIFGLNVKTKIDPWEYFQLPAFLFTTLCYAFFFSMSGIASPKIMPQYWSLIWLGLLVATMLNPLPIFARSSRFWLIKRSCRLIVAGLYPIEFMDFWFCDQLCSFSFTLSNLYLLVYNYSKNLSSNNLLHVTRYGAQQWALPFGLVVLPIFIRVVQSVRRYVDSGASMHLVNAGKYVSQIAMNLVYFLWRHDSNPRSPIFAMWCVTATISAIYSGVWDVLMDWTIFQRPYHRFALRSELMYDRTSVYYFAIVANSLVRFAWLMYIPLEGPSMQIRTAITAVCEMLRRWQWNFYRLENEHLGNKDQYRVTRQVPLPYNINKYGEEDEDDDADVEEEENNRPGWMPLVYH